MTTRHTPGPWQAVGRDVLSMHACPRASGPLVCIVDDNDNARWIADAALIAAAPELLAACMYALDVMERVAHTVDREELDAVVEVTALARAAIAKAKGETK